MRAWETPDERKTDAICILCLEPGNQGGTAGNVIPSLLQHGLRIPEDLSVVGFDDVYLSRICYPSLTTVHQDIARKGAEAVRLIMEAAAGVQERMECILPLTLVERDSVMERRAR